MFIVQKGFRETGGPESDGGEHGALHVSIAGHGNSHSIFCECKECRAEIEYLLTGVVELLFSIQAQIYKYLVVA